MDILLALVCASAAALVGAIPGTGTVGCSTKCGRSWSPVCTVFDHTYPNECMAHCRGEYVKCDGVCPCPGKPEYSGPAYPPPFYPHPYPYPPNYPGFPDAPGSYPDPPSYECYCNPDKSPVCGSDGSTYDNECEAACSRVYVMCDGPCPCAPAGPK